MVPLGATESWLLQFVGPDLEAKDAEWQPSLPFLTNEEVHDKPSHVVPRPMLRDLLGIPSHLTVLLSAGDDREIQNHGVEDNSKDEAQSLDNELDSEDYPGIHEIEGCSLPLPGTPLATSDDEKKWLETPSMTDNPTTIECSSESKSLSPDALLPSSSRIARGNFTCTQCSKLFPLMSALR